MQTDYRIAGKFRWQADLHEILTQAWLTGTYECSAGNETKQNFHSQKLLFSDKRIFYPTKITR